MAGKFPYVPSAGPIIRAIEHLRKSFPAEVTADTLRKLGIAPKNESYVINVLRFLGVIDEDGKKVTNKTNAFLQHKNEAFNEEFSSLVKNSYEELFELHGDDAWNLDRPSLTQFFRTTDQTSDIVGQRQASTFAALAALSGYGDVPQANPPNKKKQSASKKAAKKANKTGDQKKQTGGSDSGTPVNDSKVGLTVRIEVNLPADGDQETYDRIFRSIRDNLIDGS